MTESDELSGFGRVRAKAECMDVPNNEIWEIVKLDWISSLDLGICSGVGVNHLSWRNRCQGLLSIFDIPY